MKVLNLLSAGGVGGIEQLCTNIAKYAKYENIFCFLFEEGEIYNEMKDKGYSVISLVDCSANKYSKKRWDKLCELVHEADIIVTHHCTIALHAYYIALAKKFHTKKFVMTIHSCFDKETNYSYGSNLKNLFAKICIKYSLKESDKVIFVSEAGRNSYLEEFDIDVYKTTVVYNGVELIDTGINTKIFENNDCIQITYIGRLEKIKGVDLLIHAAQKLKDNNIKFKIWIIGDGSYRDDLEKVSKKLNLVNEIEFMGIKRNIGDYLIDTDIFVYPSVCQEVFGISIVEAMSYGVPCIANNVGGIPEIIKNDINGYVSDEKNSEQIYKCICKYIDLSRDSKVRMKNNCIETANRFSIQNTIYNLERELKELM
ncbi:glycosyltransferase family 4 protein [Holdemanella sp. MSK.7.32]|uniref:glycosyltransferase family 4 protein n=1 Tax=Holdemanella sp. MSK.7.32 TaxID=2965273 RepID=UPI0021093192|nr:glycosyltransferase family 4 protein [Holdemanella sp. MSK.7.32]MCQ4803755.1 glycosyltransferase family 4 protein [Holdemanella sp. MSK.7.32]